MVTDSPDEVQAIVVNRKFGGFGLSDQALDRLVDKHGYTTTEYDDGDYADPDAEIIDDEGSVRYHYALTDKRSVERRTCPALATVVRDLGADANGRHASLEVVEVPADVEWVITEYDGVETIRERHRTWPGGDYPSGVIASYDE